jgi:two-component system, NtrC family, sensor kinase
VVKAESAEAAVETLNRRTDIDLVFSDIAMPGMSGLELGRLVRDHHPELPPPKVAQRRSSATTKETFFLAL